MNSENATLVVATATGSRIKKDLESVSTVKRSKTKMHHRIGQTRNLPNWLRKYQNDPYAPPAARYWLRFYRSLPRWVDFAAVRRVYEECQRRRNRGERVVVDHIVPMGGRYVCGLTWEHNLQIIDETQNLIKGDRWWPQSWYENHSIPIDDSPYQLDWCRPGE